MPSEVILEIVEGIVVLFEALGVAAMAIGFATATVFAIRALVQRRGGVQAFQILRRMIGSSILLGLEILVAADLIRTISAPTIEEALTLGLIVLIRTVLSISIQIEIEGVLPWKRALLTSGGQVLAGEITKEAKPAPGR
ncbi:DUF1622 domain-containing protein [Gulosibacter chungangensis]|uniref:DUF1622 domain-containing protein n=1 Tax=Gulosibacter chungangensis TaxID=979746 RepID=A0A7J5BCI1_9MICO|nr:DUF1622 domain-containing protein [Gulosibacter chungangensis]KAB1643908.1 DUF1622 domain-containing protein [Gulosibacter chungangensis]